MNRQLLEKIYQVAQELPPLVLNSVIHSLGEQVFDSHYPFIDQILNQLSNRGMLKNRESIMLNQMWDCGEAPLKNCI